MFTLGTIFASLTAGYAFRRLRERQGEDDPLSQHLRQRLQLVALFGCIPLAAMLSLWGLHRPQAQLLTLPLCGVVAWSLGGLLALGLARWLRLDKAQTGSLFCCGAFTNIGAVGSLVCLSWLGEASIAITALYRLFEELFYFGIAIPVARQCGNSAMPLFRRPWHSPLLYAIFAALGLGVTLNAWHIQRPEILGHVAATLVVVSNVFFLFSIGMGLRLSRLNWYIGPCLGICAIKFVLVPAAMLMLAYALGLDKVEQGLVLKAVAILAAMPVAMNALIPPSIFHLDLDLANACWLWSTLALVAVLPCLAVLLPLL